MGDLIERGANLTNKICPICSKSFIPTHYWAYKKGSKFYCRYTCYRLAGGDNDKYRTNVKRG